jgi:hypothetical protein
MTAQAQHSLFLERGDDFWIGEGGGGLKPALERAICSMTRNAPERKAKPSIAKQFSTLLQIISQFVNSQPLNVASFYHSTLYTPLTCV